MAGICSSQEWKSLASHAQEVQRLHLKDLLSDEARTDAMTLEHNGIYFDFSRQNATPQTIKVRKDWLPGFKIFSTAGSAIKRSS
jgi:hypothetical protein